MPLLAPLRHAAADIITVMLMFIAADAMLIHY